jgi:hypothetical protein
MSVSCVRRVVGSGLLLLAAASCGSDHTGRTSAPSPTATNPAEPSTSMTGFADAPASAARVELTLDSFDLAPGGEVYKCENFQNPFGKDVAIVQSQSMMSMGSHHLAVFRIDQNADGALEDCSGLEFHATLHAAQTPVARIQLPDQIGVFMPATNGLRLNAHYLNASNDVIHAKVTVALDYVDAASVTYTAAQIYLNDSKLHIPPGPGSAGGTIALPAGVSNVKLLSTQSHMHRHAVGFQATLDDGSVLYETNTWSGPPSKSYSPPLALADGAKITWKCDYNNDMTSDLTFGESAATNEMCVLTGFYYPSPGGQMIVGDTSGGGTASLLK